MITAVKDEKETEEQKAENAAVLERYLDEAMRSRLPSVRIIHGKGTGALRTAVHNFLRKVKKYNPDIIHLHNLHNGYINLPLLFKYIKKNNRLNLLLKRKIIQK